MVRFYVATLLVSVVVLQAVHVSTTTDGDHVHRSAGVPSVPLSMVEPTDQSPIGVGAQMAPAIFSQLNSDGSTSGQTPNTAGVWPADQGLSRLVRSGFQSLQSKPYLGSAGSESATETPRTFGPKAAGLDLTTIQTATPASMTTIAGGYSHSVLLNSDGTVWTWGSNSYGELGYVGTGSINLEPRQVPGLSGMTAVAAGTSHNLVLKSDGTVWAWGSNSNGQLGNAGPNSATPVQVSGLSGVAAIAAGGNQSFAVKSDGTVWYWGSDVLAYQNTRTAPTQIASLTAVKAITAGNNHALVVRCDGSVWAWGYDNAGQVGNGATGNFYGSLYYPQKPFGLNGITAVAGGYAHSVVVKSDGTVWAWG